MSASNQQTSTTCPIHGPSQSCSTQCSPLHTVIAYVLQLPKSIDHALPMSQPHVGTASVIPFAVPVISSPNAISDNPWSRTPVSYYDSSCDPPALDDLRDANLRSGSLATGGNAFQPYNLNDYTSYFPASSELPYAVPDNDHTSYSSELQYAIPNNNHTPYNPISSGSPYAVPDNDHTSYYPITSRSPYAVPDNDHTSYSSELQYAIPNNNYTPYFSVSSESPYAVPDNDHTSYSSELQYAIPNNNHTPYFSVSSESPYAVPDPDNPEPEMFPYNPSLYSSSSQWQDLVNPQSPLSHQQGPSSIPIHNHPSYSLFICRWLCDGGCCGDETTSLKEFRRHWTLRHRPNCRDARIRCRWQGCDYRQRGGDYSTRVMLRSCIWRHVYEVHLGYRRNT